MSHFLVFRLVSALFSACLIFFQSSESLAIRSASYLATVSQPRTDLSAILISLFRRLSFAVKWSQRSLASLVSSLFNANERFSTIYKICWLHSNCILFPLGLNMKVSSIFTFLFDGCCNFFSIPSERLPKWFINNSKGSGLARILGFCFLLLQLLSVAVLMETSPASLSETCLFLLWPLLVTAVTKSSAAVGKEQSLRTKVGSGCSSSDDV